MSPQAMTGTEPDGRCVVRLISGQDVTLAPDTPMDLEQPFDVQPNGNRMWMYSLYVLRVLGEVLRTPGHEHIRPTWEQAWHSAHDQLMSTHGSSQAARIPSADHAVATRLHAFLEAAALTDDTKLRSAVHDVAERTLAWLYDESNYRPNNHGFVGSSPC